MIRGSQYIARVETTRHSLITSFRPISDLLTNDTSADSIPVRHPDLSKFWGSIIGASSKLRTYLYEDKAWQGTRPGRAGDVKMQPVAVEAVRTCGYCILARSALAFFMP